MTSMGMVAVAPRLPDHVHFVLATTERVSAPGTWLGVGAWYWADAFRGISFIRPLSGTELNLILFLVCLLSYAQWS